MSYRLGKILDRLQDELCAIDKKCMICGVDIFNTQSGFCERCLGNCVLNNKKTCTLCGSAFGGDSEFCKNCSDTKIYFDRAYSVFNYEGAIVSAIHKVKFGGLGAFCKLLASYLVFLKRENQLDFDLVAYVPMTKKSEKNRGYNQARLLAEYFCDYLEVDCLGHWLQKTVETKKQEELNKNQRQKNIKNAFRLVKKEGLKEKIVLLIDDVKTTGATLSECARVLKQGGAKRVVCLTVASRPSDF